MNSIESLELEMTPYWLTKNLPPSRHAIENAMRLAFWAAGFGHTWFTCVNAEPPVKCVGLWNSAEPLTVELMPREYLVLRLKEPNKDILNAFERVLGHKALAAFHDISGQVVVEWRVTGQDDRFAELEEAGVQDLERLS